MLYLGWTVESQSYWKKCSVCKREISFGTAYQVCSVSTCQSKRTGLTFCSVECWDSHLGFANHRSSSAEERRSPSAEAYRSEQAAARANPTLPSNQEKPAKRRIVASPDRTPNAPGKIKTDTLVVVSKVKQLINDLAGFNTSQCGIDALTQKVVEECQKGIAEARSAERKTVMGRDIK